MVRRTRRLHNTHHRELGKCGILLKIRQPCVRRDAIPLPWLLVTCHWCCGLIVGGCSQCLKHHVELSRILKHSERVALWRAVRSGDLVASQALADWYRDHIEGLIEE